MASQERVLESRKRAHRENIEKKEKEKQKREREREREREKFNRAFSPLLNLALCESSHFL
jgi:hypothetical protein